jgi:hypothetical protein
MKRIEIKVDDKYFKKMKEKCEVYGFTTMTDFILFCCVNAKIECLTTVKDVMEKELPDIKFAHAMMKDGVINQSEFERIKAVLIQKLEKSSVCSPYKTIELKGA